MVSKKLSKNILLVGDIGGTNARFAIADPDGPGFSQAHTLQCADFATPVDAIHSYLATVGAESPDVICLAAAGPVVNDTVRFTNNPWTVSVAELASSFNTEQVALLNDFAAIAYSLPFLGQDDLLPICSPQLKPFDDADYTIGVIGPGTGLGAEGLRKHNGELILIESEGPHSGFAPETARQVEILVALRQEMERISAENLVSGPGIKNLYRALRRVNGVPGQELSAAAIFDAARLGDDATAAEAVECFFEILGQVAGDFALHIGAVDGVFIAGGIAQRYPELLVNSKFRQGFEFKGGHKYLMENIPTQLIRHAQPGLLGAAYSALLLAK